jgi:hypothetical protein
MLNYAVATFCYGERYYTQVNRMLESFSLLENTPYVFIVTDSPESIQKYDFTHIANINHFNSKYSTYQKNYYEFDFSVKRFSLSFAFQLGYSNVILCDADVVVNHSKFNHELVMDTFVENSIGGQVTYNFTDEQLTNSNLGKRLLKYENHFGVEYDKQKLNSMPEDCIQFISIPEKKKPNFINVWDECIVVKDTLNLLNVPAGNIDEMCFSALYNGMECVNTSDKSINLLVANHDKWY